MANLETITINKIEYDYLIDCHIKLTALEETGVDNWIGFDEAMMIYRETKAEDWGGLIINGS